MADKRGIDIGFNGSTQYRLQASRSELRSLFDNLIGNAMLHTPEGSLVDVLLHRVAGKTVVDIVDNGPGMPESFIERAFDRFTSGLLVLFSSVAALAQSELDVRIKPSNA